MKPTTTPSRSGLRMWHYMAVLRMTMKRSLTPAEIITKLGHSRAANGVYRALVAMNQLGLLHITSWARASDRGTWVPRLRFGAGEDEPYPEKHPLHFGSTKHRVRATLIVLQHIIDATDGWASVADIMAATGLGDRAARNAMAAGHEMRLFRTRERRRVGLGGTPTCEFTLNPDGLPDEPKLQPLVVKAAARQRRQRKQIMARMEAANGCMKEAA